MNRILLLLASCLVLAACASLPLGTLWKLRGFNQDTLVQLEPSDLRAALALSPAVDLKPDSVKLSLQLERKEGQSDRHAFGLEPVAGPAPVDRERRYSVWKLDPAGRLALAAVQRELRSARAEGREAYSGATFAVNFRPDFEGEPPDALFASVQLLLTPEDGWLLLLDDAHVPMTRQE